MSSLPKMNDAFFAKILIYSYISFWISRRSYPSPTKLWNEMESLHFSQRIVTWDCTNPKSNLSILFTSGHTTCWLKNLHMFKKGDYTKTWNYQPTSYIINFAKKLSCYGIRGLLLQWIKYLTNRQQKVIIDGASSYPLNVISGVPPRNSISPSPFYDL